MTKKNFQNTVAIITIGFPFAAFKYLLGMTFIHISHPHLGTILVLWGVLDFLINGLNLVSLIFKDQYFLNVCLLTMLFSRVNKKKSDAWTDFGNAMDVMFSFSIVAIMVGANFFPLLSHFEMALWNLSVVINVLGAGLTRIFLSYQQVKN